MEFEISELKWNLVLYRKSHSQGDWIFFIHRFFFSTKDQRSSLFFILAGKSLIQALVIFTLDYFSTFCITKLALPLMFFNHC